MEPDRVAERAIADAFPKGREVVLSSEDGPADRSVRAEFLAALLLEPSTSSVVSGRRALRLNGAVISGALDLHGASVAVPVVLRNCVLEAVPILDDASVVSWRMPGCRCPGLSGTNLGVQGNLELNDGFRAEGQVNLEGARIDGDVRMTEAVLRHVDADGGKRALAASRLTVRGAFLAGKLDVEGQVRMISARIGGLLSLAGARLWNPAGIALQGERLEVGESIFFQRGFEADGRVFLQNATVRGGIDGLGSTFGGGTPERPCFQLVRGTVGRNVSLSESVIKGSVSVRSASIGGGFYLRDATFTSEDAVVNASHVRTGTLNLRFSGPPRSIDLRYSKLEIVEDDARTWPTRVKLNGCVYQVLDGSGQTAVEDRLRWIDRDDSQYRPFPYDQLTASYRASGDEQSASRVSLEKQRRRRRTLYFPGRALGVIQDVTVGYGYRNWLAAFWMFPLIAGAALLFAFAPPTPKPEAPAFQPVVYAADLLLPIVDFGQANNFIAHGAGRWVAWGLIAAGWVLTTAVVAGMTRLLNRP